MPQMYIQQTHTNTCCLIQTLAHILRVFFFQSVPTTMVIITATVLVMRLLLHSRACEWSFNNEKFVELRYASANNENYNRRKSKQFPEANSLSINFELIELEKVI